jgi:hypothetical protein
VTVLFALFPGFISFHLELKKHRARSRAMSKAIDSLSDVVVALYARLRPRS